MPSSPAPSLSPAPGARLRARVDAVVASARSRAGGGTVSVWLGPVDGPVDAPRAVLALAADAAHYAASTMKLPLLVAAHREAERGVLRLDEHVPVHDRFASAADGSAYTLDRAEDQDEATWDLRGGTATVGRLAEHATTRSGNLATNLLLERVGLPAVAAVLRDAGCSATTTVRRGIEDAAARSAGLDNIVTAADLGQVLRGIAGRSLAAPATCEAVEAVLTRQVWRDGIPAGLPPTTYVANKTGWVPGVDHDVAIVRPPGRAPYVLVVLTTLDLPEAGADAVVAELSRVVWEEWHA